MVSFFHTLLYVYSLEVLALGSARTGAHAFYAPNHLYLSRRQRPQPAILLVVSSKVLFVRFRGVYVQNKVRFLATLPK